MADIIVKNTVGDKVVATISANNINKTFELSLVGEKVEDYMVEMNNNFVKLLENFAGDTIPPKAATQAGAVEGQIWYDKVNNKVNYKTNSEWTSNADKLGGKSLDGIREYTLSGLDTTGKLSKTGGTISGEINVNGAVQIQQSVIPKTADTVSLGGQNNRFRDIYLQEDGIRLGAESAGLTFRPHNFVYAVSSDDADVSGFPAGAIILHQETGEAIIKKSTGSFTKNNATFRKLAEDKQNSATIGGNKFRFMGDVGLIAGGWSSTNGGYNDSSIEKITISTTGNGASFGNLSYGRSHMGNGMSSGTRAVFQGGWGGYHGTYNGKIDYVAFATPSNATYFGHFGHENYGSSSVSDGTRGVIGPGYNASGNGPSGYHQVAKYITLETPGDAAQFGSVKNGYWGTAISSGTRGLFTGYSQDGWTNNIQYITIQTTGNSSLFGSISRGSGWNSIGTTDANRGVYFNSNGYIDYVTIATLSNSSSFGNCTAAWDGTGLSNGVRGVVTSSGGWTNVMEYVVIQTPSNSSRFGTMTKARGARPTGASGN